MKLKVYSIFDRAAQMYSEPFVAINDDVAKRKFNGLCVNAKIMAPDLQLYCLGSFNQFSGVIEPSIELIGSAVVEVKGGDN